MVIIKDMEMPETCGECPFNVWSEDHEHFCAARPDVRSFDSSAIWRVKHCPLIEVPEPHGRLIDEREINSRFDNGIKTISELPFPNDFVELYKQLATEVKEEIGKCHTIIPSSKEE